MQIPLLSPLRNRNFSLFWIGFTLSLVTNVSFLFAITIEGYRLTGSETAAGAIVSLHQIPMLAFMLFAGVLTDRISRRLTIIVVNLMRSGLLFIVVALMKTEVLQIEHLYIVTFLFGMVNTFDWPARLGLLPALVKSENIVAANSLLSFASRGATVGGAVLGSRLIQEASISDAILVMACTSLLAAIFTFFLRVTETRSPQPRTIASIWTQLREGAVYVRSVQWLWLTIVIFAVLNVAIYAPWRVGLPLLSETSEEINLDRLYVMAGLGALLVTLVLGQLRRVSRPGRVMYMAVIVKGAAVLLVGIAGSAPLGLLGALMLGAGAMTFGTTWTVMLQTHVPEEKLGRVASIDAVGSSSLTTVGFPIAGEIAGIHGVTSIFFLGGALTVILGSLALRLPVFRRLGSTEVAVGV
jgi:MFS family permease